MVLSRLPLKEAARTSILSRRYRYLWTHSTKLDFDASETLARILDDMLIKENDRDEYMSWVDQVIVASQAPVLDCFRVRFYLDSRHSDKIDSWIKFALERRVQSLELVMISDLRVLYPHYTFPSFTCGVEFLTSLDLVDVDITSEGLTCLLSKCLLLEKFHIARSRNLNHFEIAAGPPLRLKCLSILWEVITITISAPTPDLLSFRFCGGVKSLHIESAPKLIDLFINRHPAPLSLVLRPLMHSFSQLQTLSFSLFMGWKKAIRITPLLPEMTCLKHLTLRVYSFNSDTRLHGLTSLIKKAPSLQRLTIKMSRLGARVKLKTKRFHKYSHPSLRVMELRGFEGSTNDIELALYLLSIATLPEKLIIDLRHAYLDGYYAFEERAKLEGAVNRALELRSLMAPEVQLVVNLLADSQEACMD
ncbi:putative F-box/LRR-repeat protein At3g28410 isoform X2 [Punica granatum]|nr:putative F-box/LRR-repeat protein At3g28410 isoform X2 [Punica granatum]OWM76593.1 hypothetical protein CDL15_Pgr005558 [Punica granatum]